MALRQQKNNYICKSILSPNLVFEFFMLLTGISITGDSVPASQTLGATVGNTKAVTLTSGGGQKHILATGTFNDGTKQVLLDTMI